MTESADRERAPLHLAELTWPEVAAHLERDQRLIMPVGTCEQH